MKKTLAYAAIAIILGFAIMQVPLALEPQPSRTETLNSKAENRTQHYGLVAQPSNLLPSSLILLSGLVAGLGVYAFIKKRVI